MDNKRKSTADGKRPLAASTAAEEEAVKRCDVCHAPPPPKPPVYQLGPSRGSQLSGQRLVACSDCGAGHCRSSADLAEEAINVVSQHMGYFKVACPYKQYGCASSVASRDAATHAAVCAHAPCACPQCAFLGSPAQLVRHLTDTAGPHAWPVHDIEYGSDLVLDLRIPQEQHQDKYLLVAEEDGGVFLLAVSRHVHSGRVGVVCLRGNADAGPVYGSFIAVICPPSEYMIKSGVRSCLAPGEFDVDEHQYSLFVQNGSDLHLRIRIRIRIDRTA
ncbi:hypothetical protein ACQ4PT_063244 [Festuca glaucescens]